MAAPTPAISRNNLFRLRLTVFLLSAGALPSASANPAANDDRACGPPEYCAHTDRKVEPYPDQPPQMGPAGSIIVDPNFGSRILRVTDEKTDQKQAGRPLVTPSSAEQNSWNKDSTMFYVTTDGGSFLLYDFDPSTMKARPAKTPTLTWGGEPQFSFSKAESSMASTIAPMWWSNTIHPAEKSARSIPLPNASNSILPTQVIR